MTPTIDEQTRRWRLFADQVTQLAAEQDIQGIALAGLIRYEDSPEGGTTVLAYAGFHPDLDRDRTAALRPAVLAGVCKHFDGAVALLDRRTE